MKLVVKDVEYKGQHFKEVEVDVPQINSLEDEDADWMIQYYIKKELGRMAK